MKETIKKILNFIFKFFKVDNNKILFQSGRKLIDGNPKALYCYIKEICPNDFKTVWIVEKGTNVDSIPKKEYAYSNTLKALFFQSTAKYWIRSQSLGSILKKKKNQIYIQTWHGQGALKKMGYDIGNQTVKTPLSHVKEWDYFVAPDILAKNKIISSTGYNGKAIVLGAASTDELLKINQNIERKNYIKKVLGIKPEDFNKKIIFYAPTFREKDLEKEIIDLKINSLSKLQDTIVLVRLHPLIKEKVNPNFFKRKYY